MSLQAKYQQYLAKPTAAALSADAAIHYIPTLSTFSKPQGILKHLETQEKHLKVKENFLNAIEGDHSLCVETETTIQFLLGGSAYLPGLDNNFLADRTATIPVTHVVEFDEKLKIQQIRLMWDQASLLKSVEIIGTRARNWPIHDGQDQSRLIASSISHASHAAPVDTKPTARTTRTNGNLDSNGRLALFEEVEFEQRISSPRNAVDPRESAKPAPRPYDEVFGDDEPRSPSPTKEEYFKAGAGRNFKSNRLFDDQTQQPVKSIKTNPNKFDHFDMNETSIETFQTNGPRPSTKQAAHWDFADFATPAKPAAITRERSERGFNRTFDEADEAGKPDVRSSYRPTARKDQAAHFEFGDASPPAGKLSTQKAAVQPVESAPLSSITNNARKNFESHFDMSDASPPKKAQHAMQNENVKPTPATTVMPARNARNMMTTSWDFYNEEPVVERGIKIAGNGMGGRKTTEKSWWEIE